MSKVIPALSAFTKTLLLLALLATASCFESTNLKPPRACIEIGYNQKVITSTVDGSYHYRVFVHEKCGMGMTINSFTVKHIGYDEEGNRVLIRKEEHSQEEFADWFDVPACYSAPGSWIPPGGMRCADIRYHGEPYEQAWQFEGIDDNGLRPGTPPPLKPGVPDEDPYEKDTNLILR